MSEKALHNFTIFVLIVAVVLLALVASKSEYFGAASTSSAARQMSARLRGIRGAGGALAGRLHSSGQENRGAQNLNAQIKLPTLEHFRGGAIGITGLSARLREASKGVITSTSMISDKTGHDNKATNMAIVPPMSKMTIMSNLTTK
jgi:hypothetical protein